MERQSSEQASDPKGLNCSIVSSLSGGGMKLLILGLIAAMLFFAGCTGQNSGSTSAPEQKIENAPQPESSAVTNTNDALKGPVKSNATIRGLTGDKCGSYVTYNGLTDDEADKLDSCYKNKYLDTVKKKADSAICDEIYNPYNYGACYGLVAMQKSDPALCDKINNILFERRSGHDDATTVDACRIVYVEQYIFAKKIAPPISCDAFTSGDYKDLCVGYVNKIQPPSGIGTLYAKKDASKLTSYIILEDSTDTTQVADGKLTIELLARDTSKQLYTKQFDVKKSDFALVTLGVGVFEHQDLIYQLPAIDLKQISLTQDECPYSSCNLILKATFLTTDGKQFEKTQDYLGITQDDVLMRYDSECLLISNLQDKIVDGSISQEYVYKYYVITGKVTNTCGSLKQSVKVNYAVYDAAGTELYKDYDYLDPSSLAAGKSTDFEIKIQYAGIGKDVSELPASYNVTVGT